MYQFAKVETYFGQDVVIEADAEESKSVYIILQGEVKSIKWKANISQHLL